MNRLNLDRRTEVTGALVEGNSIRSTERMTGIHRDTIMRILLEVRTGCADLMDFTRPTNGFSKKLENMKAAVSLHFAHYNFVRQHKTLRMTPAMAASVKKSLWTPNELVERTTT